MGGCDVIHLIFIPMCFMLGAMSVFLVLAFVGLYKKKWGDDK